MSEKEIKDCPFCGGNCEEGETHIAQSEEGDVELSDTKCMNCAYTGPDIDAHNSVCDLVEKGREYDKAVRLLREKGGLLMEKQQIKEWQGTDLYARIYAWEQRLIAFLARIDKAILEQQDGTDNE